MDKSDKTVKQERDFAKELELLKNRVVRLREQIDAKEELKRTHEKQVMFCKMHISTSKREILKLEKEIHDIEIEERIALEKQELALKNQELKDSNQGLAEENRELVSFRNVVVGQISLGRKKKPTKKIDEKDNIEQRIISAVKKPPKPRKVRIYKRLLRALVDDGYIGDAKHPYEWIKTATKTGAVSNISLFDFCNLKGWFDGEDMETSEQKANFINHNFRIENTITEDSFNRKPESEFHAKLKNLIENNK